MSDYGYTFSMDQLWQIAGGQIILLLAGLLLIGLISRGWGSIPRRGPLVSAG